MIVNEFTLQSNVIPGLPPGLRIAPRLNPVLKPGPVQPQHALLINPFYPKDPHASFGKHVLTPTLALTSIAGATPPDWEVDYWDENLLHGPPPSEPFPQVVGITVHLTFADRAYELARWYRAAGGEGRPRRVACAVLPRGGRAARRRLAIGEGVQVWPEILRDVEAGTLRPSYRGSYRKSYRDDPPPRRDLLPRRGFLTTTSLIATRGCHNRCGFCYLATEGLTMPYQVRDVEQVVAEFRADGQPYGVFIDNNLGSRPEYLRELCRGLRPLDVIWSAAVTIDVTDDPSLVREMAMAGCTGVFVGFESLQERTSSEATRRRRARKTMRGGSRSFTTTGSRSTAASSWGSTTIDRTSSSARPLDRGKRLECATFHILTPYPGTPLFRQMESEGRLFHKDWRLTTRPTRFSDPATCRPTNLRKATPGAIERLFSHRSIWRRRPADRRCRLTWPCRTSTSGRIGSGTC